MRTIPGHPLTAFLESQATGVAAPTESAVATLHDADVILGRDIISGQEFVVFGRDTLQQVASGEDAAEGYNILSIEIDRESGQLPLLLDLVRSARGRHDYIDFEA